MDISFSEQDLQFQEEIRAGLNGAEYPAHVKEKQEKGINFSLSLLKSSSSSIDSKIDDIVSALSGLPNLF